MLVARQRKEKSDRFQYRGTAYTLLRAARQRKLPERKTASTKVHQGRKIKLLCFLPTRPCISNNWAQASFCFSFLVTSAVCFPHKTHLANDPSTLSFIILHHFSKFIASLHIPQDRRQLSLNRLLVLSHKIHLSSQRPHELLSCDCDLCNLERSKQVFAKECYVIHGSSRPTARRPVLQHRAGDVSA